VVDFVSAPHRGADILYSLFGIRYIFSFIDAVSNFEYIQDNRVTGVSIHQFAASLFSAVIVTEEGHAFTL